MLYRSHRIATQIKEGMIIEIVTYGPFILLVTTLYTVSVIVLVLLVVVAVVYVVRRTELTVTTGSCGRLRLVELEEIRLVVRAFAWPVTITVEPRAGFNVTVRSS